MEFGTGPLVDLSSHMASAGRRMETRINREMDGDSFGDRRDRTLVLIWPLKPRKRQARGQEGQILSQLLGLWGAL